MLYCNVGRKNKLCICTGRKPNHRRYRRALYFLTTTPYSTTFCRKTWHNRAAEAAHAVTFDFSSGFYNRFPITGCRIRRFLCQNTSSEGFEPPKQLSSTSLVVFFMLHLSFIQRPASRDVNCGAYLKTVKNSRKRPVIQARPRLAKKKFPVRRKKSQYREWPSNQQLTITTAGIAVGCLFLGPRPQIYPLFTCPMSPQTLIQPSQRLSIFLTVVL